MSETVFVRNNLTGETGRISRKIFEHSFFNPEGLLEEISIDEVDPDCGCTDVPQVSEIDLEEEVELAEEFEDPEDKD